MSSHLLVASLLIPLAAPAAPAPPAALTQLAQGLKELEKERYADAIPHLRAAQSRLPELADYTGYWLAAALFGSKKYPEAIRELEPVWNPAVPTPLRGKAALLAARAARESGAPQEAVRLLRMHSSHLPQPEGDSLLAASYEAAGDLGAAAVAWQRVYYQHPASAEAETAAAALGRLRGALGDAYPPPMPQAMLERAAAWLRQRQYRRARAEYESLVPRLAGLERDLARIRAGAALYFDYETAAASAHLKSLDSAHPEADAERLYYLAECARRLEKDDEMVRMVNRLGELYPRSQWRLKALVAAANRFLLGNQPESYEPLYRACYESFPDDPQAAACHWKVAWISYLRRRPGAAEMLRDHLAKFPESDKAGAALYFLGRLTENAAHYQTIVERFPNHYYAVLARQRLARPPPAPNYALSFEPTEATRLRLARFRLLHAAGLAELAEEEARFGARTGEQPHILALELAQELSKNGPPHKPVQALKALIPGYLAFPLDAAPAPFWQLLFPVPWRTTLERSARERELDPFLVAGLIRQESEFNPGAVSPARAYGLTQILPSQGRALARQLRLRFRTSMLFRPETSLRLGTYYLRSLLDDYGGRLEVALAAYNAGPTRAKTWLGWADFREPAEFIETIPFTETRTYVLAVLRNAEIYRRIYVAEKPSPPRPAQPARKAR
ncbi:MAG: transglycosylase SLT domain-containing protein [Acidobacteriota bacterium]